MATIILSAAGAAIGGSIGGTALGLSSVAIGRFVGAAIGQSIDQRILGTGSDAVESGRVERFRLSNAGEGDAVARVYGRMRIAGQVIWASQFTESSTTTGGGKGTGSAPQVTQYAYTVNLAVALCEGEISGLGRVWADGAEVSAETLNMRLYTGSADQLPDPRMEAIEGAGEVPAYRGTAYVVFEDLDLSPFGNRVPQFTFEVLRPAPLSLPGAAEEPSHAIRGVAMMPGSGEYALATTPVRHDYGGGTGRLQNVNTPSGKSDLETSLDQLEASLPNSGAISLIVSWFGNDLRCGSCELRPKVEQIEFDGAEMPWSVSGLTRDTAEVVAGDGGGRPIYGGTPTDLSVIEAIREMNARGQAVMFYPFMLMDQTEGNTLPDPWSDATFQPPLPWRGRITCAEAPGRTGSPDGTAQAASEVADFFGTAQASDFAISGDEVTYSGPAEWRYRRFVLHCAALCAAAGGVDSFCIGSEMVGLTQIRGAANSFPAVAAFRALAAEVRAILGPSVKLGYAADWSEYFGYQPGDGSGDRFFHLDPLWADAEIDFIGIDNYMPLSDWRDGSEHLDAETHPSIYDGTYLATNVEGGELYDWYYASQADRDAQIRTTITDGQGEPWIWRVKDIRNWWLNAHHERIGGVRQATATPWVPQSKPVWFTELGCAAIDKGTNQPNKFLDPKSSESALPYYSDGQRDELMQQRYLSVMHGYWNDPGHNPVSSVYGASMIDMSRAFVWAWDARPFPYFPGNLDLWSDGENYLAGHWITGRVGGRSLALVVEEICREAGVEEIDTSDLQGYVGGFLMDEVTAPRAALQSLMLRYGFDAVERDGVLRFLMRNGRVDAMLDPDALAVVTEIEGETERRRAPEAEIAGRMRLRFIEADADYDAVTEEAILPGDTSRVVSGSELSLLMSRTEARQVLERWLGETRVSRDSLRFALPPSRRDIGPGDVVGLEDAFYRIDRADFTEAGLFEATRIEPEVYDRAALAEILPKGPVYAAPVPVLPLFLDLPLMRGDEVPHAPHIAVTAEPWSGGAALYAAASDAGYQLDRVLATRAVIGLTTSVLERAAPGRPDRGAGLEIALTSGSLSSTDAAGLLAGANLMAIGDGTPGNWELFQFRDAEVIGPRAYRLGHRLRGQLGTDAGMPDTWPVGSYVVLMNGVPEQISLAPSQRRLARHYRIGPAQKPVDDPSYRHEVLAFDGKGLRPYAPCHLRAAPQTSGEIAFSWVRRGRIDADAWDLAEIPLGEDSQAFRVRLRSAGSLFREVEVAETGWVYSVADQASDGISGPVDLEVSQISATYGPGSPGMLTFDL
ncbi:glycoside hydrolase/phage tail family protein [Pseudooceanicola sp. CBS1P-1]|uniref:Host specificity protein n=1 Tax=Pseudooceanicola albus TaxID=2692189 RepID=A0A6L7GDL3_9RHOB|nr:MULTISPECIES: glycoside hydrolase/phage tail family protein [Pseudooceanicola]MBT9384261.1 glycoside hydrolase/phage tail family protein [Pseudooceanicola endophyticus]MXN20853.1 host specificity protein [Pseudooceanicola albus]